MSTRPIFVSVTTRTPFQMAISASNVDVPISTSFAVLALFAAAAAAGGYATVVTNATYSTLPAAAAATNGSLQYTCYLCQKRNAKMIRRCPIETDDCHVACLSPPNPPAVADAGGGGAHDDNDDCFVMKVYPDLSWVVVDVVSCRASAGRCYLKCGYGNTPPGADGATPVARRGATFLHNDLPPFERCGDKVTA